MRYLLILLWGAGCASLWWLAFAVHFETSNAKGGIIAGAIMASIVGVITKKSSRLRQSKNKRKG
jgi:multidrug resistance efflux pump